MQNGSLREDFLPNAVIKDDGRTALHEAASIGDEKTLTTLLNGGVDRNAKDNKHSNTALHEAAWRGYSRCVKLLCSLPPIPTNKISAKDGKFKSSSIHHQEARGMLHSALLGTRNAGGFSALHLAAQNGHNQTCREILLAGADPDVQNNYGDTPLQTACRYGHAGATRILISAKCDPNRTNLNGDTPLHISCAMSRRKLTRILLEAGSNIDIKNAQGESPKDIAIRKKLTEILEILNTPIEIKQIKFERERSNSSEKRQSKVDDKEKPNGKDTTDLVTNPVNWSPYGCHYFPDPRTFPSPKLETLPKEPLEKGEQYYLDLAGNIRKGPIGVGNTCYCGPFFRHIEERISKNRKSIRKYVHKATERLDNKVQALALKTDDQIEQLTRSMIADRIRCEGRRLHLEHWLKRGDLTRNTTSGYYSKTKKDCDNVNTLTRCKSLEMLKPDDSPLSNRLIQNSKSFDILDDSQVIIHRDAEPTEEDGICEISKCSNRSRSRSSGPGNDVPDSTEHNSISKRLEELLFKTNEILEMERIARQKRKEALKLMECEDEKHRKRNNKDIKNKTKKYLLYSDEILLEKLKKTSITPGEDKLNLIPSTTETKNDSIEKEMKKIEKSLGTKVSDLTVNRKSPCKGSDNNLSRDLIGTKEHERKYEQEHEKSSILSGGSRKNHSSPSIFEYTNTSQRAISRGSRHSSSAENKSMGSNEGTVAKMNSLNKNYENLAQEDEPEKKLKDLISALRNDYHITRQIIAEEIYKSSRTDENEEASEDESEYYGEEGINSEQTELANGGFFQNDCFDDTVSSSNNTTLKSVRHLSNVTEIEPISEMAKTSEINELKSRILNGSNWRSQALKKTQQMINGKNLETFIEQSETAENTNEKFELRISDAKTFNKNSNMKRSKVQQLIARIQGKSPVQAKNLQSESSEEDDKTSIQHDNNKHIENHDYYYCNRAQPQVAPSLSPTYHDESHRNQMLLMTTKTLIPKDAYYYDLPNKNNTSLVSNKLPPKQMLNFLEKPNEMTTASPTLAARTRNPLPYIHQDYGHNSNYSNYPILMNPNQESFLEIQQDKLLTNRKFGLQAQNDSNYELSRLSYNNIPQQNIPPQNIPPHHPLQISLTPEQIQFERDLSNDSGFSTKIGGSSHGPSPSLSGHGDYAHNVMNSNILLNGTILGNSSNVNDSNKKNNINNNNGLTTYYVGNSSSLV